MSVDASIARIIALLEQIEKNTQPRTGVAGETPAVVAPLAETKPPRSKPRGVATPAAPATSASAPAEISLDGPATGASFLEEATPQPAKKLEIGDVRAALVIVQGLSNAQTAVGVMKEVAGAESLAAIKPDKFQAVIDAANKKAAELKAAKALG